MRVIPVIILTVALVGASGCFGKDDEGDSPTPTPTPSPTATPTGTPTPTTPTPGDTNDTTPERPAPREVFTGNADFQRAPTPNPADPANPTTVTTNPFSVPAEYTTLTLNVTWAMGSPAGVSGGVSVEIVDATGTSLAACSVPQGPLQAAPAACTATTTIPNTGGDYSANYVGEGTLTATVSVVAS